MGSPIKLIHAMKNDLCKQGFPFNLFDQFYYTICKDWNSIWLYFFCVSDLFDSDEQLDIYAMNCTRDHFCNVRDQKFWLFLDDLECHVPFVAIVDVLLKQTFMYQFLYASESFFIKRLCCHIMSCLAYNDKFFYPKLQYNTN